MNNKALIVLAIIFCMPLVAQAHPGHDELNDLAVTTVFLVLMMTILMSTGFVYAYGRLAERVTEDRADAD